MPLKHILIAVPTMGGIMKSKTTTTLVMLMRQLTRAGVQAEFLNIDSSDIVYGRNLYARLVLESDTLDGLLFVDSDMQFRPALVMSMLRFDVDVVGAAYPKRTLDLNQFARAMAELDDYSPEAQAKALANTYHYTVIPSWNEARPDRFAVKRGFTRMAACGMGCTLISRAALQAMVDAGVVNRRKDIIDGVEQMGWGFFDPIKLDDITLSEDFSFCHRWTQGLGRELWVNVDEPITHLGDFSHRTRYLDRLKPLAQPRPGPPPEGAAPSGPESTAIALDLDLMREAEAVRVGDAKA